MKAGTTGKKIDPAGVNHPQHYNVHPSGIECIDVIEHMSCNVSNAIKYLWRADEKGAPIKDLEKRAGTSSVRSRDAQRPRSERQA